MSKKSKELQMIPKEALSPKHLNNFYHNQSCLSALEIQRMMHLEGDCKILKVQYLQFYISKAIVLGFIVTLSIIGLLFVKNFKRLRAALFYKILQKNDKQRATYIYVKGTDNNEQICIILQKQIKGRKTKVFYFKHLQYFISENQEIPLAFAYEKHINHIISQQFTNNGLTFEQAKEREQQFGLNEHKVQVPGYFEYLFDCMTGAFFIFQYIVSTIYILENVAMFGILMIVFSWFTTSINYFLLRRSYNQIKQTAEKEFTVRVLRNGDFQVIKNTQLVPGDIYQPKNEIPCDSILVRGDMFTNQASLTGEDVPVSKVKLTQVNKVQESCHWIYQGSIIETVKENTLAIVINTGFGSRRGRIIRKILTKSPKQPQFFKRLIYFLIEVLIVSIIIYFATLKYLLETDIQPIMVFFRLLDFITYSFPAPFPIYFNLAYSFCLVRLHRQDIIGVQAEKTIESGRMKTICFDKTGTLTQKNKIKLDRIYHIKDNQKIVNITYAAADQSRVMGLFGCCNSVQVINGEAKGDEIDLQMFQYSKTEIQMNNAQDILRSVLINGEKYDILRINQYESRFQSMSVLVHHQNRYYIYVKGSPQMIHKFSVLKNNKFDILIKELSLQGYRSIAFGYKQVNKEEVTMYMKIDRSQFMKDTAILGIVSFVNLLKHDAKETIELLSANEINTKIITGDNIYLGVQTAIIVGMIPSNASIAILEGSTLLKDELTVKTLTRNSEGVFDQTIEKVKNFQYENLPNLYYAIDNAYVQANKAFLHEKVKVFARISPQNKALIVRNHKIIYKQLIKERFFWQRHFGQCGLKVGMVGDGANDLIAIKQADVGIGISDADAVYSASFAIKNLSQIGQIIRQAKNTERQVIDLAQYFGMVSLMYMIQNIVLTKDGSSLSSMEYIYSSFVNSLIVTLLFGVSRASDTITKYFTNINFMGLENHLVFWGNMTISSLGMSVSYIYYSNSADFVANPYPAVTFADGTNSLTKSATIVFLCQNIINVFFPLFIYRSDPWKQKFYKNKAFTLLILVNIALILAIFFTTEYLSWMDLQVIGLKEAGYVLLIMLGFAVLSFIFNRVIENMAFHEKIYEKYYTEGKERSQLDFVKIENLSLM